MRTKDRRQQLLDKLEDLKRKIEDNEDLPHGKQDEQLVIDISNHIDTCLCAWYY